MYRLLKTILATLVFFLLEANFRPPDLRRCSQGAFRHAESEAELETDEIFQPEPETRKK